MKNIDYEDLDARLEEAEQQHTRATVWNRKRDARKWRKTVRRLKDLGRR